MIKWHLPLLRRNKYILQISRGYLHLFGCTHSAGGENMVGQFSLKQCGKPMNQSELGNTFFTSNWK